MGKRGNRFPFLAIISKAPFTSSNAQRKSLEVVAPTLHICSQKLLVATCGPPTPNLLAGTSNSFLTSCKSGLKLAMTFRDSTASDSKSTCNRVSGFMLPKSLVKFFSSSPMLFWWPAEQRSFCLFYPSHDFALPDMCL